MSKTVAIKTLLLCALCIVLFGVATAWADSPVGRWSGSFSGEGWSGSASATFRSDGSCTLTALGFSASGHYGGGSIHVSAYGYSMSLSYSCSGDRMTISGSKYDYSGRMSLRRKGLSSGSEDGEPNSTEAGAVYGQWNAEADGVRYDIGLYEDGYVYWVETPVVKGEVGADASRVYGARLALTKDKLTFMPLDAETAADVPVLWPGGGEESGAAWVYTYNSADGKLALSDEEGVVLTLTDRKNVDAAPPQALFWPYITLEKGDRGEAVRQLQSALAVAGYLDDPADGIFGSRTQAAVKDFQLASDVEADGIADGDVIVPVMAVTSCQNEQNDKPLTNQ